MKRLLLVLLLCLPLSAADIVRYVDTGSAGGDGTTPTVDGIGTDDPYASLSAWEAAEDGDITGTGGNHVVHCNRTNGGGMDTGGCYLYDWTTDATHRIIIVQDDFPDDGVYDSSKFVLHNSGNLSQALYIREEYVTIVNLQVRITTVDAADRSCIYTGSGTIGTSAILIDSCIFVGDGTGANEMGFYLADGTYTVRNSTFNGFNYAAFYVPGGDSCTISNCTICGGTTYGIRKHIAGTITNCAVFNNGDDFHLTNCAADHCASDDVDGDDAVNISPGGTEATDWAAAFTSYANGDFSVKDTDSVLYHAGTDLDLATDIIGTAWDASTPSIGAFEYVAAEPPGGEEPPPQIIWISKYADANEFWAAEIEPRVAVQLATNNAVLRSEFHDYTAQQWTLLLDGLQTLLSGGGVSMTVPERQWAWQRVRKLETYQ